jgi:hypothetical protein
MLEMGDDGCPGISDYKEARVIEFDVDKNLVTLEVTVKPDANKSAGEEEEEEDGEGGGSSVGDGVAGIAIVEMVWRDVLEPVLLSAD